MTTFIAADASRSALDAYFRDLARFPPLTPEAETNLARAAIAGDPEAREKLISCNLRFVVMVAKRYQYLGLPLEDLISEGNRGILRALRKFDPDRGVRFVSYAVHWIMVTIERALDYAPMVRQKGKAPGEVRAIRRAANRLAQQIGERPTAAELAQATGIDEIIIAEALHIGHALSLDAPSEDGDLSLLDRLASTRRPSPAQEASDAELRDTLNAVLDSLPEREAALLRLHYGLNGATPMIQKVIAGVMGVTPQRIQQLHAQALDRLRNGLPRQRLEPFTTLDQPENGKAIDRRPPPPTDRGSRRQEPARKASTPPAITARHQDQIVRLRAAEQGEARRRRPRRIPSLDRHSPPPADSPTPHERMVASTAERPPAPGPDTVAAPDERTPDDLDEIRAFALSRAGRLTDRRVAAEIGIGKWAFTNFLSGEAPAAPHATLIRKWYKQVPPEDEADIAADYRRISPKDLRAFLQDDVDLISTRSVARGAGVSHSGLDKFLSNPDQKLHPRTRRLLGLYYLRRKEELARGPEVPSRRVFPDRSAPPGASDHPSPQEPVNEPAPAPAAPAPPVDAQPSTGSSGEAGTADLRRFYLARALREGGQALADSTGLPAPELLLFLQGGQPTEQVRVRLAEDYARHAQRKAQALRELLNDLDPSAAAATARGVHDALAAGYEASGLPVPRWLTIGC